MFRLNLTLALLIFLASSPFAAPSDAAAQERVDSTPSLIEVKHNVRGSGPGQYLREKDSLSVQVKAVGGVDVFVYAIYHDAQGDSILLYPNPKAKHNFVAAGKSRQIPGANAGGHFAICAPFGRERLQIIASPQPLPDLERLFNEGQQPDILSEMLERITKEPEIDSCFSDFETRPLDGEGSSSGPERVQ